MFRAFINANLVEFIFKFEGVLLAKHIIAWDRLRLETSSKSITS